jgi:ABC-type lipoprotein export system ATPase subunit
MLEIEGVCKYYRTPGEVVVALRDVSLVVEPGEVVAIMGPSGSGKSTLLLLCAAMLSPDEGVIRFQGRDLSEMGERERTHHRRSSIGFIFQNYNLLPGASALDNVALPLWMNDLRWREARARAGSLLERVELSHRGDFRPSRLSGGEQQRVAVARAIAAGPSLVLADEPTGNLDTARGDEVLGALRQLSRERDAGVILVTHDSHAAGYADRVCELTDGQLHERAEDAPLATG